MEFLMSFLVLIVPGIIGAFAFSIAQSFKTRCSLCVALILDLLTFTTLITIFQFWMDICTLDCLWEKFNCVCFTRMYILLSISIAIVYGFIFGLIRKCFYWIRQDRPCNPYPPSSMN